MGQYEGIRYGLLARLAFTRIPSLRPMDPDLVLVFKGELVSDEAIEEISGSHRVALLYPDAYRFPALLRRLPLFCCVLSAANNLNYYFRMGARAAHTIPWACDPEVHRRLPVPRRRVALLVGTMYPNRLRAALALRVTWRSAAPYGPHCCARARPRAARST
ncbi:MAG: hypothetical protein ACP5UD_08735 [Conexivisphaera sp.]